MCALKRTVLLFILAILYDWFGIVKYLEVIAMWLVGASSTSAPDGIFDNLANYPYPEQSRRIHLNASAIRVTA